MPVEIDRLQTVMSVAGAANYRAAMLTGAVATDQLEKSSQAVAAKQFIMAASSVAAGLGLQQFAASEAEAAAAGTALAGVLMPVTASLAAMGAGLAVVAAAGAIVAAGLKSSAEAGAEFEAIMKDVEIQSGASAAEMESIKEAALSPELIALGVAGNEAAESYKRLASEGYSAAQMQEMMLPIMQAAVVLGEDYAATTKLMLNIMQQYKLEAKDMPAIADAMTSALASTSMQADELALSLKYAGPIAGALGWNLGETVTVLNALIQQMGDAQMAGTYFRQMIASLMTPSKMMADAFEQAGLNVEDYTKVAGDSIATMKWMQSGTWSTSLLMKAFGAEAGQAAVILMGQSIPAMEALTKKQAENGDVQRDAEKKMETVQGRVNQLKAAWYDLKVEISGMTQGTLVEYLSALKLVLDALISVTKNLNDAKAATKQFGDTGKSAMGLYRTSAEGTLSAVDQKLLSHDDRVRMVAKDVIRFLADMAVGAVYAAQVIAFSFSMWPLPMVLGALNVLIHEVIVGWEKLKRSFGASSNVENAEAGLQAAKDAATAVVNAQINAGVWAIGGGGSKLIKEIQDWRRRAIDAIDMQAMIDAIGMPKLPTPKLPDGADGALGQDRALMVWEQRIEAVQKYRDELSYWSQMEQAKTSDATKRAQIELAFRQADLAAIREAEKATQDFMVAEKARLKDLDKAAQAGRGSEALIEVQKKIDDAAAKAAELAKERRNAEIAAVQARTRMEEQIGKLNESERKKNADHMDKLAKRYEALNDAVQMVIGGRLGEIAKQQIDRLSGVNLDKGYLKGVTARGSNEIVLRLVADGPDAEKQKQQVMGWLLPTIREAGRRAPI